MFDKSWPLSTTPPVVWLRSRGEVAENTGPDPTAVVIESSTYFGCRISAVGVKAVVLVFESTELVRAYPLKRIVANHLHP